MVRRYRELALAFWDINVLMTTQRDRPVAMLRSLHDDSYVQTRVAQYQASFDERAYSIAKSFITAKIESQNVILRKPRAMFLLTFIETSN
jgi:CRISPR/Cas system-associated endonuclease Cas1